MDGATPVAFRRRKWEWLKPPTPRWWYRDPIIRRSNPLGRCNRRPINVHALPPRPFESLRNWSPKFQKGRKLGRKIRIFIIVFIFALFCSTHSIKILYICIENCVYYTLRNLSLLIIESNYYSSFSLSSYSRDRLHFFSQVKKVWLLNKTKL